MTSRIRILVSATAVAALVCAVVSPWSVAAADVEVHWSTVAIFVVVEFLAGLSPIRPRGNSREPSGSVAFVPHIASVLLFTSGWVVGIAALSEFAAEFGVRRKPAIKTIFNVSQVVISVALSSWLFHSLGGTSSLTTFQLSPLATAAATLAYLVVNSSAVTAAVTLSEQLAFSEVWRRLAGPSLAYDLLASALAPLLAFMYVQLHIAGVGLLVLPVLFVRYIYRANVLVEQANRDLLYLMVKALEARGPYAAGHSLRVSRIAGQLARERGLGSRMVEQITTAALLHDVGEIYEDFAPLLAKERKLDAFERTLMRSRPVRSAELVATVPEFRGEIEQAVRYHHENYDGTGYPLGLVGEAIPIGARVIMLAETIDAMTSDRAYRNALPFEVVMDELRRYSRTQFDPQLVEAAVRSPTVRAMVVARLRPELVEILPGDKRITLVFSPSVIDRNHALELLLALTDLYRAVGGDGLRIATAGDVSHVAATAPLQAHLVGVA